MKNEISISSNIKLVEKIFMQVLEYTSVRKSTDDIISYLEEFTPQYKSIAYESASMGIAARDLIQGSELTEWNIFYEKGKEQHPFHILIGLGWALAKLSIDHHQFLKNWSPLNRSLVVDGMGYYFALFNGRKIIKRCEIPEEIQTDLPDFDQGVGRRLWYIAEGDVDKLIQLINSFETNRHNSLWRGVGIACAYVGGYTEYDLKFLVEKVKEHKAQLATGSALVTIARDRSQSINEEIHIACKYLLNITVEEILKFDSYLINGEITVASLEQIILKSKASIIS